jgi:hypothetical protein
MARTWLCVGTALSLGLGVYAQDGGRSPVAEWRVGDSAGLVAALQAVGESGGTVRLAPGSYRLGETVVFEGQNHVCLVGSGWNTAIGKAGAGDALVFRGCGFVSIRDLMLGGSPDAGDGSGIVFREGSSSCRVDTCRISNFPESGIRFEGSADRQLSTNTVEDCHFIGNRGDQLHSFYNNDFYIRGNQFGTHGGTPQVGCRLEHSSAGTYSENYHWSNVHAFIMGPGANFNRIENNRFEMSRETGAILGAPEGGPGNYLNIMIGNTFHTNSMGESGEYSAIEAYDTVDMTFCLNQVFSWNADTYKHRHSLALRRNCDKWIIKDNIMRHNTGAALVHGETGTFIIRDNLMDPGPEE